MHFDHIYTLSENETDTGTLSKLGFATDDHFVDHPGIRSRFLAFSAHPAAAKAGARTQYLEFCEILDRRLALTTAPGSLPDFWPQFSLRSQNLKHWFKEHESTLAAFQPVYVHRAYDWQNGDSEDKPGWNFLQFHKQHFGCGGFWITEYEKRPDAIAQEPEPIPLHPNGARHLRGLVLSDAVDLSCLRSLVSLTPTPTGFAFPDGFFLDLIPQSEVRETFRGKKTDILAVVLSCATLQAATPFLSNGWQQHVFRDSKALRFQQKELQWDLILCENLA